MNARPIRRRLAWLAGYVLILAATTGGMFWLRSVVVARGGSRSVSEDWNRWRTDVQEGDDQLGPVARRTPASNEPPAVVLMRDHFAACLIAVVVGAGLVSGTTMWMLYGALQQRGDGQTPSRAGKGSG